MSDDNLRRKYVRLIIELEAEVTDQTALDAATLDWTPTSDGPAMMRREPDLPDFPGSAQALQIGRVLAGKLYEVSPEMGIKVMSMSTLPRWLSDDGSQYKEFTVPAMPTRGEDSKLSDEA